MKVEDALEMVCQTHPGMVRSHNEDSVACESACGLVVLADGMGGYNAGEVASGIAVSVVATEVNHSLQNDSPIRRIYPHPDETTSHSTRLSDEKLLSGHPKDDSQGEGTITSSPLWGGERSEEPRRGLETGDEYGVLLLRDNIQRANAAIYYAAQSQPQYAGMGTTIVAGLFYDNRVAVAHVGDSRLYRLRGETLETITRDHSLLQEQIDSGIISVEDARLSKNKNLVTRAVGIDAKVVSEIHVHDVLVGDVYLFCSDGLNDMVEDEDIHSTLYAMQGNLPLAAEQLIQMANDNGGRDNVSVILVKVRGRFAAPGSWLARLLDWFRK